jgi:hypothetical protein
MSDEYFEKINEYWDEITGMYVEFEDKKPIIEFEPNRIRIIAYPAEGYLLSPIAVPPSVSFMLRLLES